MTTATLRKLILSVGTLALLGAFRPSILSAQTKPDSAVCTTSDSVYSAADTVRGVVPPVRKFVPNIRLVEVGTGSTEAKIIVETNGRVTVEGFLQLGNHGMREQGEVTSGLARWRYAPATLNGCPVRFRTSMTVLSMGS
jgi:hypothetical protein